MCIWHVDYFEKKSQGPKDSRRNFGLSPNCLKEFRWRVCSQNRAITRDICKEYGEGVVGETLQGLEFRVYSM